MEWDKCPMYNRTKIIEEKFVQKDICDFRWNIIGKCIEDTADAIIKINDVAKDIQIIQGAEKAFSVIDKRIEERQDQIEDKIGKLISRNEVYDETKHLTELSNKRKQNIRDTIVTGVVIAFIIGILAGGWELFKKVSIILEKTQTITSVIKPIPVKGHVEILFDPSVIPITNLSNFQH